MGSIPTWPIVKKLSLSSSALKLIAALTMLVDHVGLLFFTEELWWRVVGRISFPLFAFLIAEGYRRTSNLQGYAGRLFLFAVFSQIPFTLFLHAAGYEDVGLNIFFSLSAGLIALAVTTKHPVCHSVPFIIFISFVAELLRFDYGAYGILTVLASYCLLQRKTIGTVLLAFLPFLQTTMQAIAGIFFVQFTAVLSLPFALLYNGRRGMPLPRYFFYWFYPVHLLLLWLMWLVLFS